MSSSILVNGFLHYLHICPKSILFAFRYMYCQYLVQQLIQQCIIKQISRVINLGGIVKLEEEMQDESFKNPREIQIHSPEKANPNETEAEGYIPIQRKKYGNNLVIYDGAILITLGPDYWCFIPTFLIICLVSFFMIKFVCQYSQNIYFRLATVIICGSMPLAYLLTATSNPGIVTEEDPTENEEEENPMNQQVISRKRLCKKCNIRVRRGTYHCSDCDVCVRSYDHHCPWVSKCIGGGNLIRFYIFLAMVPIYLIYVFVVFAILMSMMALDSTTAHIQTTLNQKFSS